MKFINLIILLALVGCEEEQKPDINLATQVHCRARADQNPETCAGVADTICADKGFKLLSIDDEPATLTKLYKYECGQ